MNDYTIQLVKESFDLVEPIAPQAAELFYKNLFALDPSLESLFMSNTMAQGEKLTRVMGIALHKLDDPEVLMPVLRHLGRKHADFGLRDDQYDSVGSALLATLEQGIGVAYTPEVHDAWVDVYGVLSGTMKEAARLPS